MIHELVDLLDRSWRFLDEEVGYDFALNCFPFLEQLLRDSRTSALLADFRRDAKESHRARAQADDDARASLTQILDQLEQAAPDSFDPPSEDRHGYDCSLASLRRLLTMPAVDDDDEVWRAGRESNSDGRLKTAIAGLDKVAQKTNREDLQARIEDVKQALEHAERTRSTFRRTSAAAALVRIEKDLADLHPPASDAGPRAEYARIARILRMRDARFARIYEALFGTGQRLVVVDEKGSSDESAGTADVAPMRKDMRRIYEEIRRRLGAERSLVAVFERYRQRCEWYEAKKLRAIAAHGRGKPEDRLTETLATYLFDHGLNPLTRSLVGPLIPDILGPDAPFSFYVEAKQYRRADRKYLLDGMRQVWDTLDSLRGSRFDVAEAFYVIYRLDGPPYTFPPRVQDGDRVVHIVTVDLAPPDKRGSRATQRYAFELAELMPKPSTAAAPVPHSKRRGRVGRRKTPHSKRRGRVGRRKTLSK
jgi:hypothetical protein